MDLLGFARRRPRQRIVLGGAAASAAPVLTAELAAQLARVPTSDGGMHYAPCQVRLRSGNTLSRVYVAEEPEYLRHWGVPPRATVDLREVESIEDSPERLPSELADAVYATGETGMGYFRFAVRLRDGRTIGFLTGDAVDFPDWPPGVDGRDAIEVQPFDRDAGEQPRLDESRGSAHFAVCLYTR
jgi:hypothetical protein